MIAANEARLCLALIIAAIIRIKVIVITSLPRVNNSISAVRTVSLRRYLKARKASAGEQRAIRAKALIRIQGKASTARITRSTGSGAGLAILITY